RFYFFFSSRRRHTRSKRDWSSDVCSSDLLAFGIGDFRRDTGFGGSPMALAYARSQFTIASQAAMLPSPIDGPTQGTSGKVLTEAASVSDEFGFSGKLCLLPEQTSTINEALSPSQEELTWAHDFLDAFEND